MNPEDGPITLGDVKLLIRELVGYEITDYQLKKDLMEWLQSKGLTVDDVRIRRGKNFRYNLPIEFVEYELKLCQRRKEKELVVKELYGEPPFSKIHVGNPKELLKTFERHPDHDLYPLVETALKESLRIAGSSATVQLVIDYTCWGLSHLTHMGASFKPVVIVNIPPRTAIMARRSRDGISIRRIDNRSYVSEHLLIDR